MPINTRRLRKNVDNLIVKFGADKNVFKAFFISVSQVGTLAFGGLNGRTLALNPKATLRHQGDILLIR
jgi:hypothetical protein